MTKGLVRSLRRAAPTAAQVIKQSFRGTTTVSVAGTSGVGWGTVVIGDLPQGNILLLGAVAYATFSGPAGGSAGLADTWSGDFAIGSAPTADATINGAEVDIIPSTAVGPATAEAAPIVRATNATPVILDNTDDSLEINLQALVDDADISATVVLTVAYELHLSYVVLGDD